MIVSLRSPVARFVSSTAWTGNLNTHYVYRLGGEAGPDLLDPEDDHSSGKSCGCNGSLVTAAQLGRQEFGGSHGKIFDAMKATRVTSCQTTTLHFSGSKCSTAQDARIDKF